MKYEEYQEIINLLENNKIEETTSKTRYQFNSKIITVHNNGTNFTKRTIEELNLDKLCTFNLPLSLITNEEKIVGTIEENLPTTEFDLSNIDIIKMFNRLNLIKQDIEILSANNILLKNINFVYQNNDIIFTNILESIELTDMDYDITYTENIKTINKFLIGFLIYDLYKKDKRITEDDRIKVNKYNNTYCKDKYFGDVFKQIFSIDDNDLKLKKPINF